MHYRMHRNGFVRWNVAYVANIGAHARGGENLSIPKHMRAGFSAPAAASVQTNARKKAMMFLGIFVLIVLLATGIGFGFASAGNPAAASNAQATSSNTVQTNIEGTGSSMLTSAATRDMSAQISQVQYEEEQIRLAEEARAREEEQKAISRAQSAQARSSSAGALGLAAVDFSVGKDAFIAEWTQRIDRYLSGSPLAGYGSTFAEAAWENGVDPRWSPAISNTESTKGANCFAPYNAWGWTGGAWSSWDSAIRAHVRGLASVYGYTISYANAKKYCPPNADNWYRDTLNEMSKI